MKKLLALVLLLLFTMQCFAAIAPTSIKLDITEKTIDLANENTFELTATVAPDGASRFFKWTVSDSSVLSVDGGKVKALKTGEANVYVSVHGYGMVKATCKVKVTDSRAPQRIIVYPSRITLEPSKSVKLETVAVPLDLAGAFTFKSANENIAKVDASGLVTVVAAGETTITVTSVYDSRIKASMRVKGAYGERITAISLPIAEYTIDRGQTYLLPLTVTPQNASKAIVFSSSNPKTATVDEDGLVTAVGAGKTVITIKSYRDPSINASLKLTVNDSYRPESIEYQISGGADMMVGISAHRMRAPTQKDGRICGKRDRQAFGSGYRIDIFVPHRGERSSMLKDELKSCAGSFEKGLHTEVRGQINRSRSAALLNGNLIGNARTDVSGVSARVYKGGVYGFSSIAEYSEDATGRVLKAAHDNAVFMDSHVPAGKPDICAIYRFCTLESFTNADYNLMKRS